MDPEFMANCENKWHAKFNGKYSLHTIWKNKSHTKFNGNAAPGEISKITWSLNLSQIYSKP